MIKDILIDFMLFSLVEAFITYILIKNFFNVDLPKFNIFIMGIGFSIIGEIFPIFLYQILMCFYIGIIYSIFGNTKFLKAIVFGFISLIFALITEMFYNICLEIFFYKILLNTNDLINIWLFFIPLRIIQILIIYLGGVFKMKMWTGEIKHK